MVCRVKSETWRGNPLIFKFFLCVYPDTYSIDTVGVHSDPLEKLEFG